MSSQSYIAITYFHLLIALCLMIAFSYAPLVSKNGWYLFGMLISSFVLLYGLIRMSPGPLKYMVALLLLAVLGQAFNMSNTKLTEEDKNLILRVAAITTGIFAAMTAIGFYDNQNLLGFGSYLLAALGGLILGELGLALVIGFGAATNDTTSPLKKAMSWLGLIIFSAYVAYDTQRLKADARRNAQTRDYIRSSLGLFLDVINLFQSVSELQN